jgi:plasmid stabilization system protein ParE
MTKRAVATIFTERATREAEDAKDWFAEQGRGDELDDAIAAALNMLERFPAMGALVERRGRWGPTRRYILDRVGYHLYYDYKPRLRTIHVRSLWHERRPPPRL